MTKLSPLQLVKKTHGTKETLVNKLVAKLEREGNEDDADFKARLLRVSNKKLLRLVHVCDRIDQDFGGSKERLVDAIITLKAPHQRKDADWRAKLLAQRVTRLLDLHDSLKRKAR